MTTISIGVAPSYTISLDSLDLTYLGKYVSTPRAEKMPLWTKKRLDGESEYCEVEIVTQGNNNEDCYSEASDTYQCHICNINVPKNCYQRHDESNQHETFKKINQKVLERVSKQKFIISMNTDEDIGSTSYYCEPCSKIIEIENKNNHEATDYHAKSVKNSMIINEFYKLLNENISNEVNEELLEKESDPFNPNNYYGMHDLCTSMEASSSNESDDDPDQNSILAPVPGHSIIETVNQSAKVEENEELLEEESDPVNANNYNGMHDLCTSMEASSSNESDDDPDQNSILASVPGHSIIETVNQSAKVEENEESDPFNPNNYHGMHDLCTSMEARSSNESNDDLFDQNSILASGPVHSTIETVNQSVKVEENELLEEESDPFNPNNSYDMYDTCTSMEASSSNESDDDPDQNSILAPVSEHSTIETVNQSAKVEENEGVLEKESDPFNPNNFYIMYDKSKEASCIDSDDNLSEQNSILGAPGHRIIETGNQSPKVEEKQSFEEYLKKMIKIYKLEVTLPVIDGEFITIVAPNGDKVKVSSEHFHGYRLIRNSMYCQICNMGIWEPEDTSEHDITERHVRNMFRPINDKFARRVGKIWSHCVPCNELVLTDSDLHALKYGHKKIINNTQILNTDKSRCEDCSLYIDTHNFSVHLSSETHQRTLKLMEQNSIQDFGIDEIFCKICNLTLPKYAFHFHIGTKTHLRGKTDDSTVVSNKNNVTIINDKNNDSTINDKNNDTTINYKNDDTTINDKNNDTTINDKNNDTTINNKNNDTTINDKNNDTTINDKNNASTEIIDKKNESLATGVKVTDARFCEMCKVRIPGELSSTNKNDVKPNENEIEIDPKPDTSANTGSTYSTNRIIDSVASRSTMSSLSKYTNASDHGYDKNDNCYEMTEFVDETRTFVRCKICFVNIAYTERNIIGHMRDRSHMAIQQVLEQYNKLKLDGYNKPLLDRCNKQNLRKYSKLSFYAGMSQNQLKCELCDVIFPVDIKDLLSHMRGKRHVFAANYHSFRNGETILPRYRKSRRTWRETFSQQ